MAHQSLESCSQTEKNIEASLEVHGLNSGKISSVTEYGLNAMAYSMAITNKNKLPMAYAIFQAEKEGNQEMFQRWNFPAVYRIGCSKNVNIDVIMNFLPFGILKKRNKIKLWNFLRYLETNGIT